MDERLNCARQAPKHFILIKMAHCISYFHFGNGVPLLNAEDFFFCDLYLQFIPPINLWNKPQINTFVPKIEVQ